jgi:translation elongation factor EF-Tu-like GTPase
MATHLQVLVKFLSPKQGGRKQPPDLHRYRPHFIVPPSEERLGVEFIDGPSDYEPHEEVRASVKCLFEPDVSYDVLIVGTNFEIVEGLTIVGSGKVLMR